MKNDLAKKGSFLFTAYAVVIFLLTCVIVIPTLMVLSQRVSWHRIALRLHPYWAKTFFALTFIKVETPGREYLKRDQQYIFCSNHFSYLDIPAFYLLYYGKFIGKSSITKVPLFGYYFRKMHIPVDRSRTRSRAESVQKSKMELDQGFNLIFFPEGGIVVKYEDQPYMARFKDGAFRLAVEKNIPIVPVVMVNNFLLLPDKSPVRFHRTTCKIIALPPIWPEGNSSDEVKRLRDKTFQLIQEELLKHHPDKVRTLG